MSSTTSDGGDFLPPLYFGDLYAAYKRPRRVTSNLLRRLPPPPVGETITVPAMTSGTTTAAQQDNHNVSSTDAVTATKTATVFTVAGSVDISRQIVERSYPGLDQVIIANS